MKPMTLAAIVTLAAGNSFAAPVAYEVDPSHTYPSFEADHNGGLSYWRGKINSSSGKIVLDKEAATGSVEITMDMASIDFGHDRMNEHAKGADIFDVAKFPKATYKGKLAKFEKGAPTEVVGELTLHGVTKPVTLKIRKFMCKPVRNVETCGADASASLNRNDFGVSYGTQMGFSPEVTLAISVEARKAQ